MIINSLDISLLLFIYLLIYSLFYGIFVVTYRFMIKKEALPICKAIVATVIFSLIAAIPYLIFSRQFSIDINQVIAYIIYIIATYYTLSHPKTK